MRVEKQIVVNRPIEEVFAFIADINNIPKWLPVKTIRLTSPDSTGAGATFVQVAEFMGKEFETTVEITDYEPPHSFTFKTISGKTPVENRFALAPVEGGTNVTMVGAGELGGFLKIAGPLLDVFVQKQVNSQMASLKQALEG